MASRPLTKEAYERVRSLMLGAKENGIGGPQFEARGVPSSVYSVVKHRNGGLGELQANKILAILGQPPLGEDSLLSYSESFRASRKKAKRKSPSRQGKLFEESQAPAGRPHLGGRPVVDRKEHEALKAALSKVQKQTGRPWRSLETELFPGKSKTRTVYLSRLMNQNIPPLVTQVKAAEIWAALRKAGFVESPETGEGRAPAKPAEAPPEESEGDARLTVSSDTFLERLNGLKRPTEMRALRIQTVLKLRDEFRDDRPAMATAAGITTANLTKFIHGAKLGALELEALRRLLGPPDKFPVHAANPIAIPRASTEAATTIDQFVADLGRQALAFILNMSNQNKG